MEPKRLVEPEDGTTDAGALAPRPRTALASAEARFQIEIEESRRTGRRLDSALNAELGEAERAALDRGRFIRCGAPLEFAPYRRALRQALERSFLHDGEPDDVDSVEAVEEALERDDLIAARMLLPEAMAAFDRFSRWSHEWNVGNAMFASLWRQRRMGEQRGALNARIGRRQTSAAGRTRPAGRPVRRRRPGARAPGRRCSDSDPSPPPRSRPLSACRSAGASCWAVRP
jgi:hypothetical protein